MAWSEVHLKLYLKSLKLHASDTGVICSFQFTTTPSSNKQQFLLISIQNWIFSYQEWNNCPKKVQICQKHTGCLCKMILKTNCCGSTGNWNKAMWHLTPYGNLTPLYPTFCSESEEMLTAIPPLLISELYNGITLSKYNTSDYLAHHAGAFD